MIKRERPTISDIAQAAGVSKTTVSRYINGHEDLMSEKTRDRIKTIIEVCNYQPSDVARSLKMKRTKQVGVIISDISTPFSSALMIGIGNYLTEREYMPLFVNCDDSIEKEERLVDMLLSKNVAGLIINTTSMVNKHVIKAACDNVPIVLCDRYINDYNFSIVTTDIEKSMFEMVKHLQNQGYTRPVLFSPSWENNSSRLRRKNAFLLAVKEMYGYDAGDDIYVISRKKGITASMKLKELMKKLRPGDIPAIIGSNSVTTVRAFNAINSAGLKIPQEIGLCGPEDWDWQSEMNWPVIVEPTITTLKVATIEMGENCARLLLEKINGKVSAQTVMQPYELMIRQSTDRRGLMQGKD